MNAASKQVGYQNISRNIGVPAKFQNYICALVKVFQDAFYRVIESMGYEKGSRLIVASPRCKF